MKTHLTIDINSLPEEGKTYSGELDAEIFGDLGKGTKAAGPLVYTLYLQKFDTEVLAIGSVSAPIEFTCVRSLDTFIQTIDIENCSICLPFTGGEINFADALREEVVLLFPNYPNCEDADEPMECNLDSRYFTVDKTPEDGVKTASRDEAPNPWDALDAFKEDN